MKKIPTLFVRDPENNMRTLLNVVAEGCEWVRDGEGVATRKFDGTAVMIRDGKMFKRCTVKYEDRPPLYFESVEMDNKTEKGVGWVPVSPDAPTDKWHREAFERPAAADHVWPDGTYELCGPKIQGNPEDFANHVMLRHGADIFKARTPRDYDRLRMWLEAHTYEGIVWHHEDGRMAKIKRRDFEFADQSTGGVQVGGDAAKPNYDGLISVVVHRQVIDMHESINRAALIGLGWTPPAEQVTAEASALSRQPVWLRTEPFERGLEIVVLIEVDGEWVEVIRELYGREAGKEITIVWPRRAHPVTMPSAEEGS